MALQDYLNTINNVLQTGSNALDIYNTASNGGSFNFGGLQIPSNLVGAGSILASANMKEPGEITEARQYLRNSFTSPNALTDRFTGQIGALNAEFQPYLDQQANSLLNEVQQRAIAGSPQSMTNAIGGQELAGLKSSITNEILPGQRAFIGGLGLDMLDREANAAGTILSTAQEDPLAKVLGQMGALMMYNGGGGFGGGTGGTGGTGAIGGDGASILGQLNNLLGGGASGLNFGGLNTQQSGEFVKSLQSLASGGGEYAEAASQVLNALNAGGSVLTSVPANAAGGVMWQFPGGATTMVSQGEAAVLSAQGVGAPASGTGAGAGGFQGVMGAPGFSAGGVASGAGAAAGGYAAGSYFGPKSVELADEDGAKRLLATAPVNVANSLGAGEQGQAALGGAAGGAAAGFAVGGPIGAIIGGITGAIGGFKSQRDAEHAMKEFRLQQDMATQDSQSAAVNSYFAPLLISAGIDVNSTMDAAMVEAVATELGTSGAATPLYGPEAHRFTGPKLRQYLSSNSLSQIMNDLATQTSQAGDQQGQLAGILGNTLLVRMRQADPSIQSLDDVEGMREDFINFLAQNATGTTGNTDASVIPYTRENFPTLQPKLVHAAFG